MKKPVKKAMKSSTKKSTSKMTAASSQRRSVKASAKTAVQKSAASKVKNAKSKKQTPLVDQVPMNQSPKAQEISAPQVSNTASGVMPNISTQRNSRPMSQQQFRHQSR